jgi:signal transduction histidine kinase
MMEGEEKERTRISRELHDGIGGMLTGVKMNIKSVQKQHDRSTIQEELKNVMYMLHAMGTEIHKTAHNLMPDILLKHSFQEALHLYCEQLETGDGLKINLQFHGALGQLDKRIELPLYRIVQELIQNIIKHAAASQAAIQIKNNGDFLYISVEDNGVGFDHSKPNSGLGLRNIEARIHALSGFFSIESTLGMGTIVYIEIDLKKTMASL